MRHTSLYSFLTAGAIMITVAGPAVAQPTFVRLVANGAADPRTATRTLATYDFNSAFEGMPTRVTVADSAGTLVASFRPRGARADRPMKVAVADRDILLEAETVRGTLTIVLYDQNDPMAVGSVIGSWTLGSAQGELRARAVR
jgi:hypothetical protein